jgi:hypothetical protein
MDATRKQCEPRTAIRERECERTTDPRACSGYDDDGV